jgi:predicted alpha/beta-fold hydrolase
VATPGVLVRVLGVTGSMAVTYFSGIRKRFFACGYIVILFNSRGFSEAEVDRGGYECCTMGQNPARLTAGNS